MTDNKRLIINTLAQNLRTLLNIFMSLYSTRLVMEALGQSDYGIYMLVSGLVYLLPYFSNAMVVTTQRHLSYCFGQGDLEGAKSIFCNSYILHWIIAIVLSTAMVSVTSWIFDGHVLNIAADKLQEAKYVYLLMIVTVLLSFISSPFRALLISHENIVYISIIEVLDGMLKLSLVFILFLFNSYRLPIYAIIMSCVMLFQFLALAGYCQLKYKESCLFPPVSKLNNDVQKKLIGFASWTLYGTFCIYFRSQGLATVLNRMFSTMINASLGLATQVFGSIQFLSQAILNAITPQIVKAEGCNNRPKVLILSAAASKYSFLLLSLVVVPLVFEMEAVIHLWLGYVPQHAVLLCQVMLLASVCDQLTIGLGITNQAIGKIRNYTILTFTLKALTVPLIWFGLKIGYGIEMVMLIYVFMECLSAFVRIPFLVKTAGLNAVEYIKNVFGRIIIPFLMLCAACYFVVNFIPIFTFRFLLTGVVAVVVGSITVWIFGLGNAEKEYVVSAIKNRLNKWKK